MAANAKAVLVSEARGERVVPIDDKFFTGYRRTIIQPDEVLTGLWIPFSKPNQFFRAYKQAQRREDDIAIVTGAFLAELDVDAKTVKHLRISYGGMAPTTKLALETVKCLEGRAWDQALLEEVLHRISQEFTLPPGVPGGMSRFRQALTLSFFFKFFVHVAEELKIPGFEHAGIESHVGEPQLPEFKCTQVFTDVPTEQHPHDPVGRPMMHQSGPKHTTGEAVYCDDIQVAGCLHLAYVMSPVAHGTIDFVDYSEALEHPGVVGYVGHHDIPGELLIGHGDTPVFAKQKVTYHGQPIAAIIADDHETARRAANLVKVNVAPEKPVVTIEEAIEADSYHMKPFYVHSSMAEGGDLKTYEWSQYDKIIEGEVRMGGQEHFYLETQNCLVIPGEDQELEVVSSTQCVNDVQGDVCRALGVPRHKVVVKVKRIGGGFGGKESCCGQYAAAAAVAAVKYRRPMRLTLERFDDMAISGTRHPFLFRYKLAVDNDGRFLNFDAKVYSNAGHTLDLSKGVLERCMVHIDNVYRFGNADIFGRMCRTNLASNTAFRGFGGPQGMFATETIVKHVAEVFGFDIDEIREKNFYQEGDCTPFGMHLRQCNIGRCWSECRTISDYDQRKIQVEHFNREHKYRKRGIYLVPTKFGIGFGFKQLNQAGALVHIYTDGSVLVTHGGMEMGQGLHTKMIQIASRCLRIDASLVHINDTATDKVPNASPTAASVGSDMNGLAVQDACEKLNERLKPFKEANPSGNWKEWVYAAYANRVSLSSTGFGMYVCEWDLRLQDFF
ncbi:hypothetical protein AAVH_02640 [Aphelenchoides avenae]|nr:hypothetical protein AAVH_02640 [Aphelenchus avenae]